MSGSSSGRERPARSPTPPRAPRTSTARSPPSSPTAGRWPSARAGRSSASSAMRRRAPTRGNRGPRLVAAMEHAERLAPSVLVVQHSDRLARGGDARQARHLVEIVFWAIKADVTIRSVQDDLFADERVGLLWAPLMGMRNTEDSARKSEATRRGLQRRKDRGEPVGGSRSATRSRSRIVTTRSPTGDRPGHARHGRADLRSGRGRLHVRRRRPDPER